MHLKSSLVNGGAGPRWISASKPARFTSSKEGKFVIPLLPTPVGTGEMGSVGLHLAFYTGQ